MTRDEILRKYISEHPNEKIRTSARIIHEMYPGVWPSINAVRTSIQYRTGRNGPVSLEILNDRSLVKELDFNKNDTLKKISETYTPQELAAIANGGRLMPGYAKVPVINFGGNHFKIGAITDTHIGSKNFNKQRIIQAFDQFRQEGVDFVCHAGDVTEGMSGRPGQIYELDQLGYDRQREEAVDVLSDWKGKMYLIDGNHDRWYLKSNGAIIVKDIAAALPDAEYLGHDEGDISLNGKAILKLWHGEDGSSYAVSYRIQKVIESLSGGEKPQVMLFGHTHKSTYLFERNVHCYSLGCMESQSSWMRSKRIAAHVGFWIIDIWINDQGVSKTRGCFYPFYT